MLGRLSILLLVAAAICGLWVFSPGSSNGKEVAGEEVSLPTPRIEGDVSLEESLVGRRSVRSYVPGALSLADIAQLLWAAQGITDPDAGFRTAPSAGATYPLQIYVAVGEASDLEPGLYLYHPQRHVLTLRKGGDLRFNLYEQALRQNPVREAPVVFIITAVYQRTTGRYGERGLRYVHMEAGHTAQNLCLQGVVMELGSVVIGAFDDGGINKVMDLPAAEDPLYLIPVGRINL